MSAELSADRSKKMAGGCEREGIFRKRDAVLAFSLHAPSPILTTQAYSELNVSYLPFLANER